MIDRIDLLIAVIGIVVSVLGSSTAMWVAISKKADRDDLTRVETKIDSGVARLDHKIAGLDHKIAGLDHQIAGLDDKIAGLDHKIARLEQNLDDDFTRVENKLDGLILKLIPDARSRPEPPGRTG